MALRWTRRPSFALGPDRDVAAGPIRVDTANRPVLEVAGSWYKTLAEDDTASETWRDPFVFADPQGDGWRMLICARGIGAGRNDDGVLAEARSADLLHWEVGPPVTEAGAGFGQLEVPQVRLINGSPVLVFTSHPEGQTAARIDEFGSFCTWSVVGASLVGPWDITRAQPVTTEPALFAAPLVQQRDGRWALLGFLNLEDQGTDALQITDPIPVELTQCGLVAVRS